MKNFSPPDVSIIAAPGTLLPVTPTLRGLAEIFARQRMTDHAARRPSEDRGSPAANQQADFYGALAELGVLLEIEPLRVRMGLPCENGFLRKGKCDLLLGTRILEIKATPPGKNYCCINAEQHTEANTDTWYLPVLFNADGSGLRVMAPVSWAAVGRWDYRQDKHSPYYSVHVNTLKPLRSLESLCRAA